MKRHYSSDNGGMISGNHSERANLPQEVIMKDYSSEGMVLPDNYASNEFSKVDAQLSGDSAAMRSVMKPRKV